MIPAQRISAAFVRLRASAGRSTEAPKDGFSRYLDGGTVLKLASVQSAQARVGENQCARLHQLTLGRVEGGTVISPYTRG
jgi:hypothetical protein